MTAPSQEPRPEPPLREPSLPEAPAAATPERRQETERRDRRERRQRQVPVAVERRSGMDRRVGLDRRDQGKRGGEYDLDAETMEFLTAVSAFKQRTGKAFPTWSEILTILRDLGYEKRGS